MRSRYGHDNELRGYREQGMSVTLPVHPTTPWKEKVVGYKSG